MNEFETHSLARTWQNGTIAHSKVEDAIDDLWPEMVSSIGTDHYDNSLEVHFIDSIEPFSASMEQAQKIYDMGFSRCWLNFGDQTEEYMQFLPEIVIHALKKKTKSVAP